MGTATATASCRVAAAPGRREDRRWWFRWPDDRTTASIRAPWVWISRVSTLLRTTSGSSRSLDLSPGRGSPRHRRAGTPARSFGVPAFQNKGPGVKSRTERNFVLELNGGQYVNQRLAVVTMSRPRRAVGAARVSNLSRTPPRAARLAYLFSSYNFVSSPGPTWPPRIILLVVHSTSSRSAWCQRRGSGRGLLEDTLAGSRSSLGPETFRVRASSSGDL